jgi:hypothetical protein
MIRLVNLLARLFGVLFIIWGFVVGICCRDANNPWIAIVAGSGAAILGFLLIIARPYNPSNEDDL